MVKYICTYTGDQWQYKLHNAPEPRQTQHNRPAACVVAQQYSYATFVSLPCKSRQEKIGARLNMLLLHLLRC